LALNLLIFILDSLVQITNGVPGTSGSRL
jgi:hypothetical protein